jgi:hypothetical protein
MAETRYQDIWASLTHAQTVETLEGSFTHQRSAIRYPSAPTKVQQVERYKSLYR